MTSFFRDRRAPSTLELHDPQWLAFDGEQDLNLLIRQVYYFHGRVHPIAAGSKSAAADGNAETAKSPGGRSLFCQYRRRFIL